MDQAVRELFARYERFFNDAMAGEPDMGEVGALYASAYVAASPAGVMAGQNDEAFAGMIEQGFAHHRAIGTRAMRVRGIRTVPIDERHCMAHVDWTASYARAGGTETAIDFTLAYLVQILDGAPKVFGWVSGDEQALLKQHGIL